MVIKFAHLHNKFWAPNTLLVPESKVILNEDFVDYQDVIRIPEQIKFFKVYWITEGISGEICIPGYWNYAYVNGKFYHLVKMHANRKLKMPDGTGEQFYYYNLVYDDGQNEGLNNTFYLKGTLELTGDRDLAKENLHQMAPLIDNVNGFRHLNGIETSHTDEDFQTRLILPPIGGYLGYNFAPSDYLRLNNELNKTIDRIGDDAVPNEDKLVIPLLYRMDYGGDWRWNLLKGIERHYRNGLHVFDVTTDAGVEGTNFRNVLEQHLHTAELYLVASKANRVYTYAKSVNPTKGVEKIDLSECTNIEILDSLTLNKLYTLDHPAPKFKTTEFVEKVIKRQEGTESSNAIKDKMIKITKDVLSEHLGAIVSYVDDIASKVFRDVTVEKIDRDVIDPKDPRGAVKNPEWMKWGDSTIMGFKRHKNFIFDNLGSRKRNGVVMYQGLTFNADEEPERYKNLEILYKKYINELPSLNIELNGISARKIRLSPTNNFVLPIHEYKMVSEDDKEGYLDFSRNAHDKGSGMPILRGEPTTAADMIMKADCGGAALIPDYDRKTHVLAISTPTSPGEVLLPPPGPRMRFDPKDPMNNRKYVPIDPFILREITYEDEKTVQLNWKKPSIDFLINGYKLGKGIQPVNDTSRNRYNDYRSKGAHMLSRGGAFWLLNSNIRQTNSLYNVKYKHGGSACAGKNVCNFDHWEADNDNYKYTGTRSYARRDFAKYLDDGKGRNFQTELAFPVEIDETSTISPFKNVLDILEEYKDIPTNFLRWEVVNSGKKHGEIRRNIRTFWDPDNNNKPRVAPLTDEEQKKIPRDTVVYVGICTAIKPKGSDNQLDERWEQGVTSDGQRRVWYEEIEKLLELLMALYFNTGWSHEERDAGIYGAIPTQLQDETKENPQLYPKYLGQTNQLAMCYAKPYKGFWYTAYTRFVPPELTNRLRFTKAGGLNFNTKGHKNWLVAIVPNAGSDANQYEPTYTFRYDINEANGASGAGLAKGDYYNGQLAFLYGGFEPPENAIDFNKPAISGESGGIFRPYPPPQLRTKNIKEIKGGNHNSFDGWKPTNDYYYNFRRYMYDGNNLLLQDYLYKNSTIATKRTSNPRSVPPRMMLGDTNMTQYETIDVAIPPFIAQYLNPDNSLCPVIHTWNPSGNTLANNSKLSLYQEKLEAMCKEILQLMSNWNAWVRFVGTNWYGSIKLNNYGDKPSGDYELFTNDPLLIKHRDQSTGSFINYIENDVDVLINTRNELSIYGKTFPLKSRKSVNEDILDLGLSVTPISDPAQSLSSVGYDVEMSFNEQDVFKTVIETPKELTKISQFSAYEKEQLIRNLQITQYEYAYDKQMIEYQRRENKFMNKYEEDMNYYNGKYAVIRGALSMATGFFEMAASGGLIGAAGLSIQPVTEYPVMLWNEKDEDWVEGIETFSGSKWDAFKEGFKKPYAQRIARVEVPQRDHRNGGYKMVKMRNIDGGYRMRGSANYMDNRRNAFWALRSGHGFVSGLGSIVQGGAIIGEAYDRGYVEDERRKQKYALAEDKLVSQGMILNRKHEYDRDNILRQIGHQSANVQYPSLNNNIIYRHYNKLRNLKDVYITQYYPKGKLLKYIKDYYKEYGYMILVRDGECTGAGNIKTHLRFQFVYECNHPNVCITEMIRGRAITGIKMIPWVQ